MGAAPGKLLSAKELSARVGLSVWTINRWAREGSIPSYAGPGAGPRKARRFDLAAVLGALQGQGRGPPKAARASPGGKRK